MQQSTDVTKPSSTSHSPPPTLPPSPNPSRHLPFPLTTLPSGLKEPPYALKGLNHHVMYQLVKATASMSTQAVLCRHDTLLLAIMHAIWPETVLYPAYQQRVLYR